MSLRRLAATVLALLVATAIALGAAGDLDPGFDGDGRRLIDLGGADFANAVAVQRDGRILLAGQSPEGTFALTRLLPDGSFDPGFGGDGSISIAFPSGPGPATAMALQPDGRVVVAGNAANDVAVARVLPDGSLDPSFDGDGRAAIDFGGPDEDDLVSAVAVHPDGRVVLAGRDTTGHFVLVRLRANGTPDPDFGGDGDITDPGTALGPARAVAIQSNGRIVAAGSSGDNMIVARVLSDGSFDPSFDGDGRRVIDYLGTDYARAVAIEPDGKIVLGGSGVESAFAITRLLADGSFDTGFAGDGALDFEVAPNLLGPANALALQRDGTIVAAGFAGKDMAVARIRSDGVLDGTFSGDGRALIDFDAASDSARGVALAPDGAIVVAGQTAVGTAVDHAVARLQGDPPPPVAPAAPGPPVTDSGSASPTASPPRCGGKRATIVGTARSETLRGTRGPDVIAGLAGDDAISGLAGDDLICGGAGRDRLKGGAGADRLLGGAGADILTGGAGRDALVGGAGKDRQRQ